MSFGIPGASSAAASWAERPFQYVAIDQNLREALQAFAGAVQVPLDLSDKVRGQVRGRWPEMPARAFLDALARDYGFTWYFDGHMLSVSAASESATRLLPLRGVRLERLREGLASSGLLDPQFGLRQGPGEDVAVVSGPPRFLAVVQQSLDAIASAAPPAIPVTAGRQITVIRGSAAATVTLP